MKEELLHRGKIGKDPVFRRKDRNLNREQLTPDAAMLLGFQRPAGVTFKPEQAWQVLGIILHFLVR
jgi:hypothetical protein